MLMLRNRGTRKTVSKEKGFTLVELLIVIAILAVLAAVVIPAVSGMLGRGSVQSWQTDRKTIQAGVAAYYSDLQGDPTPTAVIDKLGHYYPVSLEVPVNIPAYSAATAGDNGNYPGAVPIAAPAAPWPAASFQNPPAAVNIWNGSDWTTAPQRPATDFVCIEMTLLKDSLPLDSGIVGSIPRTPPMFYIQDYPSSSMMGLNIPVNVAGGTHYWVIDRYGTVFSIWNDSATGQYRFIETAETFIQAGAKYP